MTDWRDLGPWPLWLADITAGVLLILASAAAFWVLGLLTYKPN